MEFPRFLEELDSLLFSYSIILKDLRPSHCWGNPLPHIIFFEFLLPDGHKYIGN